MRGLAEGTRFQTVFPALNYSLVLPLETKTPRRKEKKYYSC